MEPAHRVSPTLVLIGALAVLAGAAAALLAVGAPSISAAPVSSSASLSVPFAFDVLLGAPIVALIGVTAWSMISASEGSLDSKAPLVAIAVVILLLVAAIIVLHSSIFPAPPVTHDATGSGGGGGKGSGGSGTGTGSGGNGTGSSSGGNGSGKGGGGGGGTGSKNNTTGPGGGSNGSGGKNQSGGGGKNGTSGGSTNGTSGGGSGKKNGTAVSTATPPVSPYVGWPVYAAGVAILIFGGALIVPQLADRWRQRRPRADRPGPPTTAAAVATAQVFAQAVRRLDSPTDPRGAIVDLYRQLIARLQPRVDIPDARTPDEIRTAHLIPLGVRSETAAVLTRLFEEACYSSHAMGDEAATLARSSAMAAERDLRAAHAIG